MRCDLHHLKKPTVLDQVEGSKQYLPHSVRHYEADLGAKCCWTLMEEGTVVEGFRDMLEKVTLGWVLKDEDTSPGKNPGGGHFSGGHSLCRTWVSNVG